MEMIATPGGGVLLRNPYLQQQLATNQAQTGTNVFQQVAAVAAQRTVNVVQQTQTSAGAQATGQTENSRESRSSSETGRAGDTLTNSVLAVASRGAAARQGRGTQVDVSI